jgi:hypothetical protein
MSLPFLGSCAPVFWAPIVVTAVISNTLIKGHDEAIYQACKLNKPCWIGEEDLHELKRCEYTTAFVSMHVKVSVRGFRGEHVKIEHQVRPITDWLHRLEGDQLDR